MRQLPHEREHPVGKTGPEHGAAVRSCPPHCGSALLRARTSSPFLGLWGNHGFGQQVFVGGRLQEPRVGVLQETAPRRLPLPVQPATAGASASPRSPPPRPSGQCWRRPPQTSPEQVRRTWGDLGSYPVYPQKLGRGRVPMLGVNRGTYSGKCQEIGRASCRERVYVLV